MKALVFVAVAAVLFALCFAGYADPPISEVMSHNSAVGLLGVAPAAGYGNCVLDSDPSLLAERGAVESLEMKVVSAFPAVDDRVSPAVPPSAFWTYGEKHKDSISWETELSGNTCTSQADFVSFSQDAKIGFGVKNQTYYADATDNPVPLPSEALAALGSGNAGNLTVMMDGYARFTYDLEVYAVVCTPDSGCSCEKNDQASGKRNITFHCSNEMQYEIEDQQVLRFLQKPVLKEQWYKNNHFDNVLLTDRNVYKAETALNGTVLGKVTFYEFEVATDDHGLESISTVPAYASSGANIAGTETVVDATPVPLQKENQSFKYAYEVNSTYSGLGWNALTLKAYDDFGQKIEGSDNILSRELSFSGNISENGKIVSNPEAARPSSFWSPTGYNLLFITLGAAGLVVVFAIFRTRLFNS